MNYWFAEAANLDVTQSLFDFMEVRDPKLRQIAS